MKTNRRSFITSSSIAAGTVAASVFAFPAISYARILGSNEKIRCAVIGINGRGRDHLRGLGENVVALCDCDEKVLGKTADGKDVQKFVDYRKLMTDKSIDAVSIATPNHTHSIIGIAAAMAGKDVYCEKPVSHNVWEGRQLANAANRYNRVVQCGTQSRSSSALQQAVKFVRDGRLGRIQYAIGTCYKPRKSIGKLDEPLAIPKTIDYDLWCGPAEKRQLFRPRLHYDWHWDFNTGNGDMGNQGIHQMDIARWFLGCDRLAPRVLSIGGRVGYDDAGDTPNTQTVIHDYPDAPIIFETRGLPRTKALQNDAWGRNMDNYRGSTIGVIVQCENGYVVIPNNVSAKAFDNDSQEIESWSGGGDHFQNFLATVRSRNLKSLNAPIVEGHLSSALCHTGGISHQLGRPASIHEIKEAISSESDIFQDSCDRLTRHLAANEILLGGDEKIITLGAELVLDPETEQIVDNDKANRMLSRDCRAGFVVPNVDNKQAS